MDKFEQRVKDAREDYQPSGGFVDRTMEEVRKHKIQRRRFSLKIWAPATVGTVAVLAIAIIFAPKLTPHNVIDSSKNPISLPKAGAKSVPSASPAPISDGSDNASLQRDLSSVQASMAQTGSDQSNTDSAVNDNQQEISIPTN